MIYTIIRVELEAVESPSVHAFESADMTREDMIEWLCDGPELIGNSILVAVSDLQTRVSSVAASLEGEYIVLSGYSRRQRKITEDRFLPGTWNLLPCLSRARSITSLNSPPHVVTR
jgi:hypothetical protein